MLLTNLSPVLILTVVFSSADAVCSLIDMRRHAKTVCEGVVRQRRSLHSSQQHSVFQLDNYHVTLVRDHPKRDTLFPELHPRAKIVTADPPFPENGFLIIMDHIYHHHPHHHNEIHKRIEHVTTNGIDDTEERPRKKREHTTSFVNYCCAMPKDVKVCKNLLCGHYE